MNRRDICHGHFWTFLRAFTSWIVNVSITVLTCPFILLDVNSSGAVWKVATAQFITLTWLFSISQCKSNFAAISAFRYVCVLPSTEHSNQKPLPATKMWIREIQYFKHLFLYNPFYILVFWEPLLKVRFFNEPPKY